jgi:predicted transcriptional regulator
MAGKIPDTPANNKTRMKLCRLPDTIAVRIPIELNRQLSEFAEIRQLHRSEVVREALILYLKAKKLETPAA